jgi:hypothetical protein
MIVISKNMTRTIPHHDRHNTLRLAAECGAVLRLKTNGLQPMKPAFSRKLCSVIIIFPLLRSFSGKPAFIKEKVIINDLPQDLPNI